MAGRALEYAPVVGQKLGHYRIVEKVGAGGMGVVYRAHDEHLDRDVAIKLLPPGILSNDDARKRFRKEARSLSKLNHPNIATVHDFDTQGDVDYLVMEYVPGKTLRDRISEGPLPESETIPLATQLAEGLTAAHERGLVHRDLKPENVRFTLEGRLKILDFGLAKLIRPLTDSRTTESNISAVAGTLPYMSPEQVLGGVVDQRSDLFSFGVVLYEMATGQRPLAEVEPSQLIAAVLSRPPVPPRKLSPKVSSDVERIIFRCLEKKPENRYQSGKELTLDLRLIAVASSTTHPPSRWHKASTKRKAAVALAVATLVIVAGLVFHSRRVSGLTPSDTIVLADFDNKTGDEMFDDTLKQALAVHLEQSPFLNVLPDEKINSTLRLMGRQPGERLTASVARDLCQRTGSKAMLAGSIAILGTQYVVGVNAINCRTGESLGKEQTEAAGKEQVLNAVRKAANELRRKIGESPVSVQEYDTPLEQATTPSLEALKAFSSSWKAFQEHGDLASVRFLERAVELDPNFALAYASLAPRFWNLGQAARAKENAKKAFQLRERVSERERYRISVSYHFFVTGERHKLNEVLELWRQAYPHDAIPYIDLGVNYMSLGQWKRALPETEQGLHLDASNQANYGNLAYNYFALNRLEEANRTLERAQALKLDSGFLRLSRYFAAFLGNDAAGMQQELSWRTGRIGEEDVLLSAQSDTEAYLGRLAKAREFSQSATEFARHADANEAAAYYQANAALREAEFNQASSARRAAQAALTPLPGWEVRAMAALALARAGNISEARKLADALNQDFPQHTIVQGYWLPAILAAVELNRNNGEKAVELLRPAAAYELGGARTVGYLYPVYLRGQAYLLLHEGAEAAAEFQRMIDHRGIMLNFPTGALAQRDLGRARTLAGDTAGARHAYEQFLTLWKDADPDIPILQQAKAEYAKLQ